MTKAEVTRKSKSLFKEAVKTDIKHAEVESARTATKKVVKPTKVKKVEKVEKKVEKKVEIKPLVSKKSQTFIDAKITKLGSLEAVKKEYKRSDEVSRYAREKAAEIYGGEAEVIVAEKKVPTNKFAVIGKGFDTQKGKVVPFEKEWAAKKKMRTTAQKTGLDITGYKVFEQDGGWVFQQQRSVWDAVKEFEVPKKIVKPLDTVLNEKSEFKKDAVIGWGIEKKVFPQERSKIDPLAEKLIKEDTILQQFGKEKSTGKNLIPFKVRHYAEKLQRKLGNEFEVKAVDKGFIVDEVGIDNAKIVTVTRVTSRGDSIPIKISRIKARQEIKDNNVTVNRLKGMLDCL